MAEPPSWAGCGQCPGAAAGPGVGGPALRDGGASGEAVVAATRSQNQVRASPLSGSEGLRGLSGDGPAAACRRSVSRRAAGALRAGDRGELADSEPSASPRA